MPDLSLFRFSHPIAVRFADIDALQHVNNATTFTYMETARVEYFRQVLGWVGRMADLSVIIARAECDFKLPIFWGDQVFVHVRASRLGNKSFDFEYVITTEAAGGSQQVAAVGKTVQVAYDYAQGATVPIPDDWREKMLAFEPGLAE